MTKNLDQFTIVVLVLALSLLSCVVGGITTRHAIQPQCQEDAVIVGTGDFEHGRWTEYECGPSVDDYND